LSFPIAHGSLEEYEQRQLGYRERFSTPTLGGGRTVAVLTEPLELVAPITWVVLHSFGPEHDNLAAFDAALCRAIASSGHATVRFHSQGQGDSELGPDALGVEHQIAGALDAIEQARSGIDSAVVGLIGVRFGGAIAAMAAARADVGPLVLIDPVTKGRAFLRSLARLDRATEVSLGSNAAVSRKDPFEIARAEGVLEIEGFAIPWPAVVEFEAIDLIQMAVPLRGPVLVLQVSRSEDPREELMRLVERLGARAVLDVLVNEDALRFGLPPWRLDGTRAKVDSLAGLAKAIIEKAVRWCVREAVPSG
jgi:pimeloyl-ACP methyl ester carboxylesterase